MHSIETRIELAVAELERLCTRLGTVAAIQSIVEAGVDVTRALERLDDIQPLDNQAYLQKHSVKMEQVLATYMREEKSTQTAVDAARLLLLQLVYRKNGLDDDDE